VPCPEGLQVQAYVDGEVDALTSAAIERHLEQCAECRNLQQDVIELRTALRQDLPYLQTPPALRAQVMRILDKEDATDRPKPPRSIPSRWRTPAFWLGAGSGLGTAAVAATLALWLLAPPLTRPVIDEVVGAHVSSLMTTHLIDVVSTDQHTVKPWFDGHTDVSPVVADFEAQGYKLVGGRVDYLEHQRAAVVVYRHGLHIINVFSWAATQRSLPSNVTRSGYHLVFWRVGDLQYCAVSDTAWDELLGLVRLLQDLGARDARP
jgi:anti-sigma factor RsiW